MTLQQIRSILIMPDFKGGWNMLKKKLIALLLASSMALTGFVSVYGAEDFLQTW